MELTELKITDDAIDMPVFHPVSGEKTDIILQVIGLDSEEYKSKARAIYKTALKKAPQGDLGKLDEETDRELSAKLRAIHIKGWSGMQENGQDLPYNTENAIKVMRSYPWLRDQVEEFAEQRANFIKG